MDFTIMEKSEIKQEQEDFETNFRIIEFEHIFKPEPIKEEFPEYPNTTRNDDIKIEPIEEEDCSTLNYIDIKLEPIELQEDSISPMTNTMKFEPINLDHSYARSYQPFIDRIGKHKPKISEIKKKFKVKSRPCEPQICSICGEKFVLRSAFERHLLRHGPTRSLFECDVCGAKCKLMKHLQRHMLTMHAIANVKVPCNVCGKSFDRRYVTIHMGRHTTRHQKPSLECTICGKYFHIQANLTSHMRTHRKKKAPCNVCGKSFTAPGPLRVHQRIHTGEKVIFA